MAKEVPEWWEGASWVAHASLIPHDLGFHADPEGAHHIVVEAGPRDGGPRAWFDKHLYCTATREDAEELLAELKHRASHSRDDDEHGEFIILRGCVLKKKRG